MAPPARYCVPGERLCSTEEATAGSGTYTRHGFIFSSLAGCLERKNEDNELPVVSVVRDSKSQLLPNVGAVVTCKVCSINSRFAKVHILYVGSTPLKSTFRGTIRREDIRATEKDKVEVYKSFRPSDIVLAKVISLGDAQSNYLLSTAENELGVVVARSEAGKGRTGTETGTGLKQFCLIPALGAADAAASLSIWRNATLGKSKSDITCPGVQMVPISWCEMQCPRTHTKEFRKVARVQPQFLQT
ncbi:Exosome complex component CSL4 [Lonchura striata]|uniref:Exosome complex component CSL4 n=1 Tax=Lonchura striata TaxID=40157 RepID=A0A218V8F8_9PASE|nr:exosome complex component CSL4 isoform X1 [Lonchura striata domestica]OWK62327.1 Exosome complex component CSL4 [Lonchura striata domestica]